MMEPTSGGETEGSEALKEEGERIARLLEELPNSVGPQSWRGVEELVRRIVGLYGAALKRLLDHLEEGGASEVLTKIHDDEFLSSILLLHGMHSLPVERRITQALELLRPRLSSRVKSLRLDRVESDGLVAISLRHSEGSSPRVRDAMEKMIQRAVEEAAPEVGSVLVYDEREKAKAMGFVDLRVPGAG